MKFTIAIPTRNRAKLLPCAIKSALNQDYNDYEILISNNFSDDDTESVIAEFEDPKIRYIKTERPMSMVDHWNFVMDHVKGEWIFYLCDDDAIASYTLSYINAMVQKFKGIKVFSTRTAVYTYGDFKGNDSNTLNILRQNITKKFEIVDSKQMLRRVYNNLGGPFPRILNSFIHHSLIERIRENHGKVFFPWAPDFTNGIMLLIYSEKYIRLYKPLCISGKNMVSYGSGARVDPETLRRFFSEFDEFEGSFRFSPYPDVMTVENAIFETLNIIQSICGDEINDLEIDPYIFREKLLVDTQLYIDSGFNEYLTHHAIILQDIKNYSNNSAKSLIDEYKIFLKHIIRKIFKTGIKIKIVQGKRSKPAFSNIYEASQYVNEHYGPVS